jgi:signal transduction histidine kinase
VNHDLRNAFQLVVAHNGLALHLLQLRGQAPTAPNVEEAAASLQRNERMLRLMAQHFHMMARTLSASSAAVTFEPVDVDELLRDLHLFCEPVLRAADVELVLSNEVVEPLTCDRSWLFNCLINICKNGCQAMETNPVERPRRLSVRSWSMDLPDLSNSPHVVMEFSDTGPGMSREQVARFRTGQLGSTKRDGLGLGTQSILRTLELHQSPPPQIESEPGRGTMIRLFFRTDLTPSGRP